MVFFQNFSRGAKSGEICFFPLKTKNNLFLLKISNSRGDLAPPSDAHEYEMCVSLLTYYVVLEMDKRRFGEVKINLTEPYEVACPGNKLSNFGSHHTLKLP